jgi:hypothetical protein
MQDSQFRLWVNDIWQEHRREYLSWEKKPCPYDASVYFRQYRWWLKREYQARLKKGLV